MKIIVIGGAGTMGQIIVQDLMECPDVQEILIADYNEEKAKFLARSFNNSRINGVFSNATQVDRMAAIMKGFDAVINAAQYDVNLNVMEACLKAECHYNDLGGMFHITRKQMGLHNDFKRSGLTAVLGIGSAPGITNILARYAYDRLDEVEIVQISNASTDLTDMKGIDVFNPPYSIRTIMEEYAFETVQFIDGEYKTLPPLSGAMEIYFPEPIGKRVCIHTLHSEPATIPDSFRGKGIKEVTWRLSLEPDFEKKAAFLSFIGFSNVDPIEINGQKVIPREALAAVLQKHVAEKLQRVELKIEGMACLRAHVIGRKDKKAVEYTVDCIAKPHSRWGSFCDTSTPPSIVAQMQINGMIKEPGVWAPEQVIDPEFFFKELSKREMRVSVAVKEQIA